MYETPQHDITKKFTISLNFLVSFFLQKVRLIVQHVINKKVFFNIQTESELSTQFNFVIPSNNYRQLNLKLTKQNPVK